MAKSGPLIVEDARSGRIRWGLREKIINEEGGKERGGERKKENGEKSLAT